jgi:hypothetical protein
MSKSREGRAPSVRGTTSSFEAFCRQGAVVLENARLYDGMAQLTLLSRKSG